MVDIKFCGMTRAEDVAYAVQLGAAYVGVIFAESPRQVTEDTALRVLEAARTPVKRVGVFGPDSPASIARRAQRVGLDVVQLHGDPDVAAVAALRERWGGAVWAVRRVRGAEIDASLEDLFDCADAVVLDARVHGTLGGTGVTLPWQELRSRVGPMRHASRLVLAGGLRPENVARAVEWMEPDVVDVSSGVESGVGVKDHVRMRGFRDAVYWVTGAQGAGGAGRAEGSR